MGAVKGICISKIRGIQKHEVAEATLKENWGIEGDAHAGDWQRQISLLDYAEIEHVRSNGTDADFGTFGENLIVEGYDLKQLPLGTRLRIGEHAVLELTQIGKQCHRTCGLDKAVGECVMPREGIFTRVLHGGVIHVGDPVALEKE